VESDVLTPIVSFSPCSLLAPSPQLLSKRMEAGEHRKSAAARRMEIICQKLVDIFN
jgi:hypothetical protein